MIVQHDPHAGLLHHSGIAKLIGLHRTDRHRNAAEQAVPDGIQPRVEEGHVSFLQDFRPEMIGMGPFLPHKDTPFAKEPKGSYELTLYLLSLCRLMLPHVLLPATTALGTIHPQGREQGVLAGANVIMPNLSPTAVRKKYMLYDNKICTEDQSSDCRFCLQQRMKSIGYEVAVTRGDYAE